MHTFTLSLFSSALTPTGSNKGCSITRGNSYLYQPRKKLFNCPTSSSLNSMHNLPFPIFNFISSILSSSPSDKHNEMFTKRKRYPLNNQVIQLASHRFAKMNISKLKLLGSTSLSSNVDWCMQRKKKLNQQQLLTMEMDYSMEIPARNLLYLSHFLDIPPFFIWRFYVPLFFPPRLYLHSSLHNSTRSSVHPTRNLFSRSISFPHQFSILLRSIICAKLWKKNDGMKVLRVEWKKVCSQIFNWTSTVCRKKKFISLLPAHINSRFFHSNNNNKQIEENFSWNWNRI